MPQGGLGQQQHSGMEGLSGLGSGCGVDNSAYELGLRWGRSRLAAEVILNRTLQLLKLTGRDASHAVVGVNDFILTSELMKS
jgi:hypothetical protein